MEIETYVMGPIATNTYLLSEGNDVIVIDPASKPEKMIEKINGRNLLAVLLTHGHFDHIKAVTVSLKNTAVPSTCTRMMKSWPETSIRVRISDWYPISAVRSKN